MKKTPSVLVDENTTGEVVEASDLCYRTHKADRIFLLSISQTKQFRPKGEAWWFDGWYDVDRSAKFGSKNEWWLRLVRQSELSVCI